MQDERIFSLQTYQYELPGHLIARYPVEPRDHSRLLVLDRKTGHYSDQVFRDLVDFLQPGDTLVLNDTRVIPARLHGYRESGAQVEILLLKRAANGWEALVKPARRLRPGERVLIPGENEVKIAILDVLDYAGGRLVAFLNCEDELQFLERRGEMPLPPYIDRPAEPGDIVQYQTVYAREAGSAAAPTAGLHFTTELLDRIADRGINLAQVLLHVGLGTFRPVSSDDIRDHQMHEEFCRMNPETAELLNATRARGGRIIAVGTTVVRTLESLYDRERGFVPGSMHTACFIYPGYCFRAIDGLVTNFHLPGSSLLMLVAAFAGLEETLQAYRHAVEAEYRFFSYGDAMLML
jgi:S-adenosylmethionine:tRNA ribosyltransferase-isomerase